MLTGLTEFWRDQHSDASHEQGMASRGYRHVLFIRSFTAAPRCAPMDFLDVATTSHGVSGEAWVVAREHNTFEIAPA